VLEEKNREICIAAGVVLSITMVSIMILTPDDWWHLI
jgi:hypothetical protein